MKVQANDGVVVAEAAWSPGGEASAKSAPLYFPPFSKFLGSSSVPSSQRVLRKSSSATCN